MQSEIKITNRSGAAVIDIEGVIGVPENMQFERPGDRVATYAKFTETLKRISSLKAHSIEVNIRSSGGDVGDALLIYDALAASGVRVTTRCFGYVASAATIIAQAASPGCREVSANTLYLIHCSESTAEGNTHSLSATKELLDNTDRRIAAIYSGRSGRPAAAFAELMNENNGKGRWMSAAEVVAVGLADKIIPTGKVINMGGEGCLRDFGALMELLGLPLPPELQDDGDCKEDPDGYMVCESGMAADDYKCGEDYQEFDGNEGFKFPRPLLRAIVRLRRLLRGPLKAVLGEENNAVPGEVEPNITGGVKVSVKAVVLEKPSRQSSARPTSTKQKEDPSPAEYIRTPNEQAYESDIQNIKYK